MDFKKLRFQKGGMKEKQSLGAMDFTMLKIMRQSLQISQVATGFLRLTFEPANQKTTSTITTTVFQHLIVDRISFQTLPYLLAQLSSCNMISEFVT